MATKIKTEETLGYQADMNFYAFCIFSYGRKLYRYIDVVREPINGNPYNCKKIVVALELTPKGGYVAIDVAANRNKECHVLPAEVAF